HPIGQKLLDDITNFDKFDKTKIYGSSSRPTEHELRIINFQTSKLFDAADDTICFEELPGSGSEWIGRWCYNGGLIFSKEAGGTTGSLDVEAGRRVLLRKNPKEK